MLFFFVGNGTMNPLRQWQRRYEPCSMMPVAMLGPVQKHWWLFKGIGRISSAFEKAKTGAVNFNPTLGIHFQLPTAV
jgi:hypothetical protein